jgi:tetratricopeptide (TPR) repeat protein
MIRVIKKLFARRSKKDPTAVIEEIWAPSFKNPRKERFLLEETDTLVTSIDDGALALTLKKKNVFGWAENPWYRYRDFALEATIGVDPANGHSSAGFLIRQADDLNYYFFLVTPSGKFRFDVVFNGNPRTLIAWTACPLTSEQIVIRIIARGSYFSFRIDEEWIAEIEDDTIDAGSVTFAAQNYGETDTARYDLARLKINSRPYDVEAQYYRWRRYVPVDPERRLVLARSLAAQGDFTAAVVQYSHARKGRALAFDDLLTVCECYLQNGFIEEADQAIDGALKLDGNNPSALAAKANLLYRQNKIIQLRDFLERHPEVLEGNSVMWNLFGNAWYTLGNNEEAARAYERASAIDPDTAVYHINAARSWENVEETPKALDAYIGAARLLFREENYTELSGILPQVERLDTGNNEARAIKGKLEFSEGRYDEAEKDLKHVLDTGCADSSIHYLYGILLVQRGEREEAAGFFEKATEIEPDYYLYWFRRGENEHLLNRDSEDSIHRALDLKPEDKWVLNLTGLIDLEHDKNTHALESLKKAYSKVEAHGGAVDPEDEDILINYSEALHRTGDLSGAIAILSPAKENPVLLNQLGNILSKESEFERAIETYERAIRLAPAEKNLHLNCAAACIEADRVHRAEELLNSVLNYGDDATAYNLMGNAAQIKGEHQRSEAAYLRALEFDPAHEEAAVNLADLRVRLKKYADAKVTIDAYLSSSTHPRIDAIKDIVRGETEVEIACAECGRMWTADKQTEPQPRLKIRGELSDEAPAGMCAGCGRVYCVGCAKTSLREGRFFCPECEEPLKLSTDHLKLIVSRYTK